MKIEHSGMDPISAGRAEAARPVDPSRSAGEAARWRTEENRDRAWVSERARLLAAARAELAKAEEVRQDRVEEMRKALEAGTYQVPHTALARRLGRLFSAE